MTPTEQKLRDLLNELFRFDRSDLDFGIYRIMNLKRDQVQHFIDVDLLPQIRQVLERTDKEQNGDLAAQLEKAREAAKAAGLTNPDEAPKVKELLGKYKTGQSVEEQERQVFGHLYEFFHRYYKDGDFIPQARYKKGVYALPYEGEEVKLSWANQDQYYIKTSEELRDYSFVLSDKRLVHFHVVQAEGDRDNNKAQQDKERRLILASDNPVAEENGELVIRLEYRPAESKRKQDEINEVTATAVIANRVAATWKLFLQAQKPGSDKGVLAYHLRQYTARSTFDYFIHKDLGGFLRRELDFYLKNEVLDFDSLAEQGAEQSLQRQFGIARAVQQVGGKIIDFLAQLEDFEKKLWLKKKFVVRTDWCVTLDRVPRELYPQVAANTEQVEEWQRLFSVQEIEGDTTTPGFSEPPSLSFLEHNPNLVVDTWFFDQTFKDRLLSSFPNLDEQTDGLLVHSENFQALELLQERYRKQVKCIYADPPYNTGNDGFAYKDNYQHSTWASMMTDRLSLFRQFLSQVGVLFCSINGNETTSLRELLNAVFGSEQYQTRLAVKVRHENRILRADAPYQDVMEDVHMAARSAEFRPARRPKPDEETEDSDYCFNVKTVGERRATEVIDGFVVDIYDDTAYTVTKTSPGEGEFKRYTIRGSLITQAGSASEFYEHNLRARRAQDGCGTLYRVMGMGVKGDGLGFRYVLQPDSSGGDNGIYFQGKPLQERRAPGDPYPNYWDMVDAFNDCKDEGGVAFPGGKKPTALVQRCLSLGQIGADGVAVDAFAGSGTSGHAVINLNREDGGHRKYILVEMGDYFDTVLKPRIEKVIYSKDWKDGKPVSREGSSHMFKYMALESYDDTMANLQLKPEGLFEGASQQVHEQYMLCYMLETETQGSPSLLNTAAFDNPSAYTLKATHGSETVETMVDLVETFNYLIGLHVRKVDTVRDIRVVQGVSPTGERVLVLWRNVHNVDADQLNDWFTKQGYNTRDAEFDVIYVNGDNHLQNLRRADQTWKVRLIEPEFQRLMFDVQDV